VCAVGVEIDPGNITLSANAKLMALEEEVTTVVVVPIGSRLSVQNRVGVLVWLGLVGFDVMRGALNIARQGHQGTIVVVAVVARQRRCILEARRALCDDRLGEFRRKGVGCDESGRFRICTGHMGQICGQYDLGYGAECSQYCR